MSLVQIGSIPISPRLPTYTPVNRPARGLFQRFSKPCVMCDNDEGDHVALKNRQPQANKGKHTYVNISLFPTGSTITVQCEDGGPWTHRTVIRHGSEDHNRGCYKSRVKRTNQNQSTSDSHPHICRRLPKEMKGNEQVTDKKLNKLIEKYAKIHNS